ncbi:aminopeptidase P family protein [Zhouia amylolytica]|uniref:Xaa-Pro aminopeptidase n=1 Tax=Zhouia amylolytica AD3 TaxID=1286632 RepID=W2UJX5_9FLAO|nr:aminopeptidase P family protein [Zhouia amylolytica]ETN94475.1 xaa-Pro aminopeptidase [Zhouia amylolytica AD3]
MFSKDIYVSRRQQLQGTVKSGILLFPGNGNVGMNCRDNWFHFRQDSTFLYYTGINQPDLYFLIDIDNDKEILFGNDLTPEDMVWVGAADPLQVFADKAGIQEVRPLKELASYLKTASGKGQKVHYLPPYRAQTTVEISEMLDIPTQEVANQKSVDFIKAVVAQRSYKSDIELSEITKAVDITADMHIHAIKNVKVGRTEKEIAAELEAIASSKGSSISFPIILTKDGQYLHNHATSAVLNEGDLVLVDCGAETLMNYAGDMTRTMPAGERFTDLQKEVYNIVLDAHESSIAALKPGVLFKDVHELAASRLVEGLKGMGLMKGNTEDAVQAGAHTLFFQCGLGHMMGMDVHDMENLGEEYVGYTETLKKNPAFGFRSLRLGRALEERFVITVEPGLYFNPFLIDKWKAEGKYTDFVNYDAVEKFKTFGGIRVEEDLLITKDGSQILGKPVAKTVADVEELKNS